MRIRTLILSVLSTFSFVSTSAPQEVDLRNAECGFSARGPWTCDFEYHLRGSAERNFQPSSFSIQVGGSGTYSISGATEHGKYNIGGGGAGSIWQTASSEAGKAAMVMQHYAPYFPGVYESARGDAASRTFYLNEKLFAEHLEKLNKLSTEISQAQGAYSAKVAEPALVSYLAELQKLKTRTDVRLSEVLPKAQPNADKAAPVAEKQIAGLSAVSIDRFAALKKEKSSLNRLEKLSAVWEAGIQSNYSELPAPEATAVKQLYDENFNYQGLVNEGLVSPETAKLSGQLAPLLQTPLNSVAGMEIRKQVNRGLIAYDSSTRNEIRSQSLGAITLALGADQAFSAGDIAASKLLLHQATETLDFILGFVPVAGSINDATQIVWGMAFGHDYNGNPMSSGDYALRGLGVFLGLLPTKAVIEIGKKTLGPLFASGANIIRRLGLSKRFASAASKEPNAAVAAAEAVGHYAVDATEALGDFVPRRNAEKVAKVLESKAGMKELVAKELVEIKDLPGPHFHRDAFLEHFAKHIVERDELVTLGISTPKQYLLGAQKLVTNKAAKSALRPDGRTMYFLEETGEFAVMQENTIITYFKPDKGIEYWLAELKKHKL